MMPNDLSGAAKPLPAAHRAFWKEVLSGRTNSLLVQLIRYVAVGMVATACDFCVLVTLVDALRLHYLLANACGFFTGLLVNYALSTRWVFASRNVKSRPREFAVFGAIGVAGLGISELCMYMGVEIGGLHYAVAKVIAVVGTLAWNFGLRKALLFRGRAEGETV
jgi:putative flippase GtrA